jgi:hypothetical protein
MNAFGTTLKIKALFSRTIASPVVNIFDTLGQQVVTNGVMELDGAFYVYYWQSAASIPGSPDPITVCPGRFEIVVSCQFTQGATTYTVREKTYIELTP